VIGGVLEPGEEPGPATVREVKEETGLDVEIVRLTGVYMTPVVTYPNGDRMQYITVTFLCRVTGGAPRVNDDESTDVAFFEPDKLPPTLADVEANPTDPPSAWEKLFPVKGATAAAVCAAYEAALAPVIASELSEDRWPGPPAKPYCKLGGALFAGFRPTSDVTGVRDVTLKSPYATHRAFILETKSGAVLTFDAVFAGEGDDGIETASSKVLDLRVEDRELRLRVAAERKRERYCAGPAEPTDFAIMTSEFDLRCPLDASPLTCTRIDRRESCRGFSCESFGLADDGAPR
jgi:hypothetical protein